MKGRIRLLLLALILAWAITDSEASTRAFQAASHASGTAARRSTLGVEQAALEGFATKRPAI